MCYAKPGPRCSAHAMSDLKEATRKVNERKAYLVSNGMSIADDAEMSALSASATAANFDYLRTPAGIEKLRFLAKTVKDPQKRSQYLEKANEYENERKKKLKTYNLMETYNKSKSSLVFVQDEEENVQDKEARIKNYAVEESNIRSLFKVGESFNHGGSSYVIAGVGKPISSGSGGEPKTDVFVRGFDPVSQKSIDFKISYKGTKADFAENKVNESRAQTILGENYKDTLVEAASALSLGSRALAAKDESAFSLGVRLDIMMAPSSESYFKVTLPHESAVDIYAGTQMDESKRHSHVPGLNDNKPIENSGVANYLLTGNSYSSAQEVMDSMVSIDDYATKNPHVYLAFKNLNYGVDKDKWDGNRPLAFATKWSKVDGVMSGTLDLDNAFAMSGNESGKSFLDTYKDRTLS